MKPEFTYQVNNIGNNQYEVFRYKRIFSDDSNTTVEALETAGSVIVDGEVWVSDIEGLFNESR